MEHLNYLTVVSYSIADLRIDIELEKNLLHFIPKSFTPFHISQEIPTNMHLCVSLSEKTEDGLGIKILTSFDCAIGKVNCYRKDSHMKFLIIRDGIKIGSIQMNDDASKTKLEIFISELANELISFTVMLMYSSYTSASSSEFRIVIHASVIVKDELAYVFYGKSGIGKSTQTNNWLNAFNDAWLLNDDNPIIIVKKDGIYISGSPWSGKTPIYINRVQKISALVSLGRSQSCKLYPLQKKDFISQFLGSCCYNPLSNKFKLRLLSACDIIWTNIKSFKYLCNNSLDAPKYFISNFKNSFLSPHNIISLLNECRKLKCCALLTVEGNSMHPSLRSGISRVVINPSSDSNFNIGDIVLAIKDGLLIHRVMKIDKETVTLKGDDNEFCEIVKKNQILGKIIKILN